ncbi:MAG: OmpA family protein [Flavobacteriales bacterium]|nr:OmpA family protein [Flavobacteriales bacterium]
MNPRVTEVKGRSTGIHRWALLAMVVLSMGVVNAQDESEPGPCDPPTDKKVLKLLDEAAKAKDPVERHQKLKATLEVQPECGECLFRTGVSAFRRVSSGSGNYAPAIAYLEKLKGLCPDHHADQYYYLGVMYEADARYAEAMAAYDSFLKFSGPQAKDHAKKVAEVEARLPGLAFYRDFYKPDRAFNPVPLRNVSTSDGEYLPMLSPDNEILFFTRQSRYQARGDLVARDIEQLCEARRPDTKSDFNKGAPLPEPFNSGDNYGGVTISVNNKELFVTVGGPPDAQGYRNFDLFRCHYETRVDLSTGSQVWEWGPLENLGPAINTPDGWESQPSLSADGRTLFFSTLRRDSRGMDIYHSTRDPKGVWTQAQPLAGINTDGNEKAPFLHSDSHTLYFAAGPSKDDPNTGHQGGGGYDIFYSRMQEDGSWGRPVNMGHPINSEQDEHGLIVSADGRLGYFASNRLKGVGGLDIFSFELPKEARPDDVLIVKGEVKDERGQLVRDARVEITYMDSRKTETLKVDSADGRYAAVLRLKPGADVRVTILKKDHVFDARVFTAEDTARGGVADVDMQVQRIAVGKAYRVSDIHYATGSADITPSTIPILEQLATFLKENPSIKIAIHGHTDDVGRLDENMALSNDRAFTVMSWLQDHGIAGPRLSFKGFGPTKPVAQNTTPEGRAQNRRTEFVIISR